MAFKSIGEQIVIAKDNIITKTVYAQGGVGYIVQEKKHILVTLFDAAKDVRGRQTWKIQFGMPDNSKL